MEPNVSESIISLHSSRPSRSNLDDDDNAVGGFGLTPSMSVIDIHSAHSHISARTSASRASSSTIESIALSFGAEVRKDLDQKRRPKVNQLKPDRPPPTAAPPVNDEPLPSDGPRRKSLQEYVEIDMTKFGQKSVLFRFLAIGTHEEDPDEFLMVNQKIIEVINTACYDECATGYLLVYPKHFIHLLEGSELTINKYIAVCAELFEGKTQTNIETDYHPRPDQNYTAHVIILNYMTVRERFTDDWYHVININPSHRGLMHYKGYRKRLFEFCKNIWVLSGILAECYASESFAYSDVPQEREIEKIEEAELNRLIQEKLHSLYPGTDMLNYLLKSKKRCPQLRTPFQHIEKFWTVPNIILDSEVVWPVPSRLVAYH